VSNRQSVPRLALPGSRRTSGGLILGRLNMKKSFAAAIISMSALCAMYAVPASANSDDNKWIGRCISDNATQGQPINVITAYCTCMNNKMSENETRTITQWEKTHKPEADECSKEAGWN
jgi:hypothetical protein